MIWCIVSNGRNWMNRISKSNVCMWPTENIDPGPALTLFWKALWPRDWNSARELFCDFVAKLDKQPNWIVQNATFWLGLTKLFYLAQKWTKMINLVKRSPIIFHLQPLPKVLEFFTFLSLLNLRTVGSKLAEYISLWVIKWLRRQIFGLFWPPT